MPISCKICNKEFQKQITNSHLKTHGITTHDYKSKYGDDSLSSVEYKEEKKRSLSGENNPNFGKRHKWADEQKNNIKGRTPWNKGIELDDTTIQLAAAKIREERYKSGELIRSTKKHSEETKLKISKSVSKYAEDNHTVLSVRAYKAVDTKIAKGLDLGFFRGRKHTDATKKVISEKSKSIGDKKRNLAIQETIHRMKASNLEMIGSWEDHYLTIQCNTCNTEFEHTRQMLTTSKFNEKMCRVCYPREVFRSKGEIELYDFILGLCPDAIPNYRYLVNGEVDVYIPSKNITFEYNGLYWHSDDVLVYAGKSRTSDFEKHELLESNGIRNIVVFEDEWHYNQDIVKSRIKNLLGYTTKKIYARECKIQEITSKEASRFCNINHMQGAGRSNVRYGLFYNDELVSVMTFSKSNLSRKINEWELNRFCSKLDYNVVFAATRLFIGFLRKYNPETVITYADRRWSKGDIYSILGFVFDKNTVPNYWYWYPNEEKRIHRYTLRKTALDDNRPEKEIRKSQGYNIIYDCGSSKWVWHRPE